MNKDSTKDMTKGDSMQLILGFAVPLLFGLLFQQAYSIVDTIIVGKYLGVKALAAVGSTGSINFLILGFCIGICTGFALPVAQRFGAKDFVGLRKFVGNGIVLALAFSVAVQIVTTVLCRWILELLHTPTDIIDMAYDYIIVFFIGIPVIVLYNLFSSYVRSLGDSLTPLLILLFSAVFNVGLDLLFVVVFNMGVFGASLATVISELLSVIFCVTLIYFRFKLLIPSKNDLKLDKRHLDNLLGMGLPMGLQYSITAIGSVILQAAVNGLGSIAVASIAGAIKISGFFVCPFDALGSTMATYGGQNVGAGEYKRLNKGLVSASILGIIYSVFAFIVLFLFSDSLIGLFVNKGEVEVYRNARLFLLVNSAFYFPLAWVNIIRFLIQGMGFSYFAIFAGVFEMIARTAVALLLVPAFGYIAACFASPAAWVCADIFLLPAYFYVLKKIKISITG